MKRLKNYRVLFNERSSYEVIVSAKSPSEAKEMALGGSCYYKEVLLESQRYLNKVNLQRKK